MRISFFATIFAVFFAHCYGQILRDIAGGFARTAVKLLEPIVNDNYGQDGYRFRYATDEQVREEKGEFVDGIWTVRGVVEWLSPDRTMKHMETYVSDDKGYKAQVMDEPFDGRAGLSPGALASLAG